MKSSTMRETLGGWQAAFLFGLVLLFALLLMTNRGTGDVVLAQHWIDNVMNLGFRKGFEANQADYPPLSSAVLWLFSVLTKPMNLDTFWILKTACLCCLIASSAVVLFLERSVLGAILLVGLFMLESTGLAYLDIFYTPLLVLAFWALRHDRLRTFSLAAAAAAMIKWQPLIIFPFLLVHLLKDDASGFSLKRLWPAFYPGAILGLAVLLVYGVYSIKMAFYGAIGHRFLSANALNLGWIITYYLHWQDPAQYGPLIDLKNHYISLKPGQLLFQLCHQAFIVLFGLTVMVFALRPRSHAGLLLYSAIGLLCYFMVNPGVHENHSYIAVLLLLLLAIEMPQFWPRTAFVGIMLNVNLLLFYGLGQGMGSPDRIWAGLDISVPFALLNFLFFSEMWLRYVALEGWQSWHRRPSEK